MEGSKDKASHAKDSKNVSESVVTWNSLETEMTTCGFLFSMTNK
jgi:hypothetical protein